MRTRELLPKARIAFVKPIAGFVAPPPKNNFCPVLCPSPRLSTADVLWRHNRNRWSVQGASIVAVQGADSTSASKGGNFKSWPAILIRETCLDNRVNVFLATFRQTRLCKKCVDQAPTVLVRVHVSTMPEKVSKFFSDNSSPTGGCLLGVPWLSIALAVAFKDTSAC